MTYGYSDKSITFIYSYLKWWKQNVKIDDTLSIFQTLISIAPQGSILGPIPYNIFYDLVSTLEKSDIYNFAGDNAAFRSSKSKDIPFMTLENKSEKTIDWFKHLD